MRIGKRWHSIFFRWHLRHAVTLLFLCHVAIAVVIAFSGQRMPGSTEMFAVFGASPLFPLLAVMLGLIDRRRRTLTTLYANLGFSEMELVVSGLAVTTVVEMLMALVASALR